MTAITSKDLGARPLALVAEDNVTLREHTVRTLDRRGIGVIPVGSLSQAAHALAVSPCVDVALLDIHLDVDKDRDDRGGIAIAQLLRKSFKSTRIIGYSGKFRENTLSGAELGLFDTAEAKGALSAEDHLRLWEMCATFAIESYARRRAAALAEQERLRRLYEVEAPEVEVLRRFRLDDDAAAGEPVDAYTAEGALGLAGYRVKVIILTPARKQSSRPFVVWEQHIHEDDTEWLNVEVYGQPELYATGKSEVEALESLASFMELVKADIAESSDISEHDRSLNAFLSSLFPEE